ncbi:uncharacterized protein LOC141851085 isoform X2 [Brevipalpus obovatus]
MDGLRHQLVRRKSGIGSSQANLRPPTVERCDEQQVTLRGWLYRLEGGIKQWKRRWFVLGDYCLFYYKDVNEGRTLGSVLLPSYRVSPCKSSEDGIARKYAFKLEHQNMKTYFLAADSKESMDQWMQALSLASIMQLNYHHSAQSVPSNGASEHNRNQPDRPDLDASRLSSYEKDDRKNDDVESGGAQLGDEEDSGFNSYKSRRGQNQQSSTNEANMQTTYLPAGHQYPNSYNCVGLPPISYSGPQQVQEVLQQNAYAHKQMIYPPPQKRSHYANAPPKPRRQQLGNESAMDFDIYSPNTKNHFAIPPGAHYHQYLGPSTGPAPDLIAHNPSATNNNSVTTNGNDNYFTQSVPTGHQDLFSGNNSSVQNGLKMQYNLSSPLSPPPGSIVNPHYSIPPPQSLLTNSGQANVPSYMISSNLDPVFRYQTSQISSSQLQGMSSSKPRPRSADFLDREQEDSVGSEGVENGFHETRQNNGQQMVNSTSFYQRQPHFRNDAETFQSQVAKSIPARSKSSLERYDPYSFKNTVTDYNSGSVGQSNAVANHGPPQNLTSPPPRPWSDYLQQESNRLSSNQLSYLSSTKISSPSTSYMPNSLAATRQKTYPPSFSNLEMSPHNGGMHGMMASTSERDVSLQRLLEWKQKMLSVPIHNKRQINGGQSSTKTSTLQHHASQPNDIGNNSVPMRPPLPKEYCSRMSVQDVHDSMTNMSRSMREEPIFKRERSKSIGSSFPISDVTYSSDDEGLGSRMKTQLDQNHVRRRHESCGTTLTNIPTRDQKSPDYMNINHIFQSPNGNMMGDPFLLHNDPQTHVVAASLSVVGDGPSTGEDISSPNMDPRKDFILRNEDYYKAPSSIYKLHGANQTVGNEIPPYQQALYHHYQLQPPSQLPLSPSQVLSSEDWAIVGLPKPNEQLVTKSFSRPSSGPTNPMNPSFHDISQQSTSFSRMPPPPPPKPSKAHPQVPFIEDSSISNRKLEKQIINSSASDSKQIHSHSGSLDHTDIRKEGLSKSTCETNESSDIEAPLQNLSVKERIKSLEGKKQLEEKVNVAKEFSSPSGVNCSLGQTSGVNVPSLVDYNIHVGKVNSRAELSDCPQSSFVLADLHKTAEIRREKIFIEEQSMNQVLLNGRSSSSNQDGTPPNILGKEMVNGHGNSEKLKDRGTLDSHQSLDKSILKEDKFGQIPISDQGEEADDEMSRDFDATHYQSELTRNTLLPLSAKQILSMRAAEKKQNSELSNELAGDSHSKSGSDGLEKSSDQMSVGKTPSRLNISHPSVSDSFTTSMDNPAYVSASFLETNREVFRSSQATSNSELLPTSSSNGEQNESDKTSKLAPYYYSDLLDEEEAANRQGSSNATGSSDQQATADQGKQGGLSENTETTPKSGPSHSADHSPSTSKTDTGDKLEQVYSDGTSSMIQQEPMPDINIDSESTNLKALSEVDKILTDASVSMKRLSRCLENFDEDHLYENIENFRGLINPEGSPKVDVSNQSVSLHEASANVDRSSKKNVKQNGDSDSSDSMIECGGSQSGAFLDKKSRKRRSPRNRRSQDDLKNVSDSETASRPPPPPPLPLGYNQHGYPFYSCDNTLKMQKKLSRSVGTGLQDQQETLRSRIFSSAGDLLDKSHEELVLLLIQLRRNQAHLQQTCDQLRMQMESEEKLMEIEPQRTEEHKARFEELRESLAAAEHEYESQFPVIDMVDNLVKFHNPSPGYRGTNIGKADDFDMRRAKAASTSFLDKFSDSSNDRLLQPPTVPHRSEQFKMTKYLSIPKPRDDQEDKEQGKTIKYLQQDIDLLERTLDGVRSSLTNLSLASGQDESTSTNNIERMKQQQQTLEKELGRVRGLIAQSAKRLERKATENVKLEKDAAMARGASDQVTSSPSASTASNESQSNVLATQLANINQAIDDLTAKRREILESFKKQHTEDSELLQEEPKDSDNEQVEQIQTRGSYAETDLDTMQERDLAPFRYIPCGPSLAHKNEESNLHLYANLEQTLIKSNSEDVNQQPNYSTNDCYQDAEKMDYHDFSGNSTKLSSELDYNEAYDYQDTMDNQYNYPQASTTNGGNVKTVRSVKRESERRKVTRGNFAENGAGSNEYCQQDFDDYRSEEKDTFSESSSDINISKNERGRKEASDSSSPLSQSSSGSNSANDIPGLLSSVADNSTQSVSAKITNDEMIEVHRLDDPIDTDSADENFGSMMTPPGHQRIQSPNEPSSSSSLGLSSDSMAWHLNRHDSGLSIDFNDTVRRKKVRPTTTTPDLVRSTLPTTTSPTTIPMKDQTQLKRELSLPRKIEIPRRYIADEEEESSVSNEELVKRSIKAESFRKILTEAAYGTFTPIHRRTPSTPATLSVSTLSTALSPREPTPDSNPSPLRKICSSGDIQSLTGTDGSSIKDLFGREKRRRADLLALNSEIAREVTERSRMVAILGSKRKKQAEIEAKPTSEECPASRIRRDGKLSTSFRSGTHVVQISESF